MESVSTLQMIWMVAVAYLATYGIGAPLYRLAGLRVPGLLARVGLSCGIGVAALGWIGWLCAINGWALAIRITVWLAVALGVFMLALDSNQKCDDMQPLSRNAKLILIIAIVVAFAYRGAINWGQVGVTAEGAYCRGLWPDLLYRNAIVKEFMTFDGMPEWPWLSGQPLKGTSILRFSSVAAIMVGANIAPDQYQLAAGWLGLFGIPVAAGAIFALLSAMGVGPVVAALAVLVTAFFGNPRWLMAERFAHSPSLVWAGDDVFSIVFPVVYGTMAIAFALVRRFSWPLAGLAIFMLGTVTAFGPWFALALLGGIGVWFFYCIITRTSIPAAVALIGGTFLGVVTLKLLCGTGVASNDSPLAFIGPSPVIRDMNWAFPFLAEPIHDALAGPSATGIAKLIKFTVAYVCAVGFFLLGSLWTRAIFIADWRDWDWRKLMRPQNALVVAIALVGIFLTSCCDFRKVAYTYADYDMLRLLWLPLIFGNLALAQFAYVHRKSLLHWWGIAIAVIVVGLGAWEYSYYVVEKRIVADTYHISSAELEIISYLNANAGLRDTVLLDPWAAAATTPERVGHNWGYVSGLVLPGVYLDNHDMAFKFAQDEEWNRRAQLVKNILSSTNRYFVRSQLAELSVDWVYLQRTATFGVEPGDVGLSPVIQNDAGCLYRLADNH